MKYNTQNAKIASITEETLVLGIDVGSETHYVRAFDWRNYEFSDKPLAFSNDEAGFLTFMAWVEDCLLYTSYRTGSGSCYHYDYCHHYYSIDDE